MKANIYDTNQKFAAVFIDFENIFYFLMQEYADLPDLNEYIFHVLRSLKKYLENNLGLQTIILKAYADYERLKSAPQGSLYLMGIETHNVLGTEHKNAADMKLCIDTLEILYTRPEITSFVFLAGDRDYIPVIQHLKKQARSVYAVAFRGNISGDLLMIIGEDRFIDAHSLFDPDVLHKLEDSAKRLRDYEAAEREREEQRRISEEAERAKQLEISKQPQSAFVLQTEFADEIERSTDKNYQRWIKDVRVNPLKSTFRPAIPIYGDNERLCLEILLRNYGRHPEIWLSPYLRKLSDTLSNLADFERKALLSTLEANGAIQLQKRQGEPFDYTVIVINYNHPTVREMYPGLEMKSTLG